MVSGEAASQQVLFAARASGERQGIARRPWRATGGDGGNAIWMVARAEWDGVGQGGAR